MPHSGHSTRKQLAKGRFFEGLQNYMEIKKEGNENEIILGDFNCTVDKMERDTLWMSFQLRLVKTHRGYWAGGSMENRGPRFL